MAYSKYIAINVLLTNHRIIVTMLERIIFCSLKYRNDIVYPVLISSLHKGLNQIINSNCWIQILLDLFNGIPREFILRGKKYMIISFRCSEDNGSIVMCVSSLPGLNSAESTSSGEEVAPMTINLDKKEDYIHNRIIQYIHLYTVHPFL